MLLLLFQLLHCSKAHTYVLTSLSAIRVAEGPTLCIYCDKWRITFHPEYTFADMPRHCRDLLVLNSHSGDTWRDLKHEKRGPRNAYMQE